MIRTQSMHGLERIFVTYSILWRKSCSRRVLEMGRMDPLPQSNICYPKHFHTFYLDIFVFLSLSDYLQLIYLSSYRKNTVYQKYLKRIINVYLMTINYIGKKVTLLLSIYSESVSSHPLPPYLKQRMITSFASFINVTNNKNKFKTIFLL